jgi:Rrf2 family protein
MMLEIARSTTNGRIRLSLSEIAKTTNISRSYLEQLAVALRNASLIVGVSGKRGGYLLARPADTIPVGEIVEAAIGPINIVECVKQPDLCLQTEHCGCRKVYERINEQIHGALDEFSLADLTDMSAESHDPSGAGVAVTGCPTG